VHLVGVVGIRSIRWLVSIRCIGTSRLVFVGYRSRRCFGTSVLGWLVLVGGMEPRFVGAMVGVVGLGEVLVVGLVVVEVVEPEEVVVVGLEEVVVVGRRLVVGSVVATVVVVGLVGVVGSVGVVGAVVVVVPALVVANPNVSYGVGLVGWSRILWSSRIPWWLGKRWSL
jgi:hypothetical protein